MTKQQGLICAGMALLSGCSSMTPTKETSVGYAIYDIKASAEVGAAKTAEATKVALQKNTSRVQIPNGIPPSQLPDKGPRFQRPSPFKGSNLAALAAAKGQSLQVGTCLKEPARRVFEDFRTVEFFAANSFQAVRSAALGSAEAIWFCSRSACAADFGKVRRNDCFGRWVSDWYGSRLPVEVAGQRSFEVRRLNWPDAGWLGRAAVGGTGHSLA